MALGTFTPPVGAGKASSFDPRTNANKPLIVVVREFREGFTTTRFPNPKDVVICDVVDLMADTVYPSVIWGAAAVVDRLKHSAPAEGEAPEKLPVILKDVTPQTGGNKYATIQPLEDAALQLAIAWDAKYPTRIEDERAAYLAAQQEAQKAQGSTAAAVPSLPATSSTPVTMDDDALAKAIAALG